MINLAGQKIYASTHDVPQISFDIL